MSAIARICPVCNGVRGLRGSTKSGERLCLSSNNCMKQLLDEINDQSKEPTR